MDYHEPPVAFFRQIGEAVEEVMERHEREFHRNTVLYTPPTAMPFDWMTIPDEDCARIVEIMEAEQVSIVEAAGYTGYPVSLALRVIPQYMARYKYWCERIPYAARCSAS